MGERCHTVTGKILPVTHSSRKWAAVTLARDDEEEEVTHLERRKELTKKS